MSGIAPISPAVIAPAVEVLKPAQADAGAFARTLAGALGRVEQAQKTAAGGIEAFLSGENEEVHQVALAAQRSELAFELFLQVRNKIVAAYQEVMRMQM